MAKMKLKMRCADCKSVEWCKYSFGKYWHDRSGGGEGCAHPLPQAGGPTLEQIDLWRSALGVTLGLGRAYRPKPLPLPTRPAPKQGELKLMRLVDVYRKRRM